MKDCEGNAKDWLKLINNLTNSMQGNPLPDDYEGLEPVDTGETYVTQIATKTEDDIINLVSSISTKHCSLDPYPYLATEAMFSCSCQATCCYSKPITVSSLVS